MPFYKKCNGKYNIIIVSKSIFTTSVQCPDLTNPDSGIVSIETDGLTSHAKYTCVDQYKLVGVAMRTCKTDGSWEYEEPLCSK